MVHPIRGLTATRGRRLYSKRHNHKQGDNITKTQGERGIPEVKQTEKTLEEAANPILNRNQVINRNGVGTEQ